MKKFTYLLAFCAAVALLFSCTKKEEPYVPGEPDLTDSYRISFPAQTITPYEVNPDDPAASTVTITATREVTSGRITVPLVIEQVPFDAEQVFEHTDLVFEDGAATAQFQVSFPKAEIGKEYSCHIMIDDPKYASLYSQDSTPYVSFKFIKLKWETKATGTLNSWYAEGAIPNVVLQHCETYPERYRFVDPYGEGFDLAFTTFGEEKTDEDGDKFYYCRVAPTETPSTYGSYGAISYRDLGYWQADDSFAKLNTFYPDYNSVTLYINWYVSAGNLGYGAESFRAN